MTAMLTRRIPALTVLAAAVLTVAGCSSSPATSNANSQTIVGNGTPVASVAHSPSQPVTSAKPAPATSAGPTCDMAKEPDVYVFYKAPGMQNTAQELGGWDPTTCKPSIDKIMAGSATGSGYCTAIGWKSQNPGYNPDATPAKPLKHVIEEIGGSC